MYVNDSTIPSVPSTTPEATAPATGTVASCDTSAIELVDEIGLPLTEAVRMTISGITASMTPDGSGIVRLSCSQGTNIQIELADQHEAQPGDSQTTPSGQHFQANGTGP